MGDLGLIPGLGRSPGRVFWPGESPWAEEPDGLQSTGSQRVGHNWLTKHNTVHNAMKCYEKTLKCAKKEDRLCYCDGAWENAKTGGRNERRTVSALGFPTTAQISRKGCRHSLEAGATGTAMLLLAAQTCPAFWSPSLPGSSVHGNHP